MCGITGYWAPEAAKMPDAIQRMTDALIHRGPDDSGHWTDEEAGLALGHRRLSIVDLSRSGHQPMVSASGRFILVLNGEIYNHLDLRARLEGNRQAPDWHGHADTETLLAAIEQWGIRGALEKTTGMFAFAVWDREQRALTLARDRIGEKPLYYGWQGDAFLFGSELKSLRRHPAFKGEIDRDALTTLMRSSAVYQPHCIYRGISKLLPGTMVTISRNGTEMLPTAYWDARTVFADGRDKPFAGSPDAAVEALESHLGHAIARQRVADVPLGAFLSGGVDSSTVVALMQAQSSIPVRTFSIGFDERGYDEATHAAAVARHLGTDHTELYVRPRDALAVIPDLPAIYDEPFGDSSQLPTVLLSRLTREHVTVALSGDGGDELFGGYNRHVVAARLWPRLSRVPKPLRLAVARMISCMSPDTWSRVLDPLQRLLPATLAQQGVGEKLHKAAAALGADTVDALYRSLASQWPDPEQLVLGAREPDTALTSLIRQPATDGAVHRMMALDLLGYLPNDILTKVDRAAMAASLETRLPMLDHHVVEFAWRLPVSYKLRDGVGKWPLRQVLYRHVPRELIERPKAGFAVPLDRWLRGPLRDWAEHLLDEQRLREDGYLNPDLVRRTWNAHLSGRHNLQHRLWNVLMFQAWLDVQKRDSAGCPAADAVA